MKKGFVLIIISLFLVCFVNTSIACPWGLMGGSTQTQKGQSTGMPMDMRPTMRGSMTDMGDRASQRNGEEKSQKSDQGKETPEDSREKSSQLPSSE